MWEKLSKDQQQMIIDHNRSLTKSGSTHLSTPNKSPSPLPHKPTPQQTAKSQQVHTHQSDESTTDTTKTETTPSDPLLAMVHQSIHTSDDDASDISNVLSVKRSRQIQVCQRYLFQHANHTNQQLVDPKHKGSKYNVMVEWESGEVTYEPLTLISKDDPSTCAVYAKKHDLLDTTGWKHLKRYAKTSKRLIRAVKQSRIRHVRASARYQHVFQVPKDYNDAIRLDKENSNTHWQDAMDLELTQIHEYKVFKDTGKAQSHNGKVVTPDGFQKIRVHFVYAVKHDNRFKARLVADGHLTKEPVESIYSAVDSLRSLRMVVFLSQLNDLEIWGADVGNTHLEAYTDEKLCIIAGPELKELQGHLLIMIKALYGTRSGGARWHDRLFDILQELKFKPSKADPDVWMRPEPGGTCYEYIAVYVDDLAIAAKDPQAFCHELKKRYNLKLKGVGPLEYHLGCTYKKDPDGTLAADPRRYVNKILESYERMFKEKPRKSRPPLEGGDHPELDTSELCDEHQTKQFSNTDWTAPMAYFTGSF